jgi:hypothetical protein
LAKKYRRENVEPRHSDDSVSDIVRDMPTEDEIAEEEALALEEAQAPVTETTFVPQPASIKHALEFAPTVQQAREVAQIPEQKTIKDIVGKAIVIVDKVKQSAFLPADGTQRPGYQCLCVDVETGKPFTVWIGQTVLRRELSILQLPFRTALMQRGRTYIFS